MSKLYHYNGPVTIYKDIACRNYDQYIHANSTKQALFLLQKRFVKDNPRLPYAHDAWLDIKYIKEEVEENKE